MISEETAHQAGLCSPALAFSLFVLCACCRALVTVLVFHGGLCGIWRTQAKNAVEIRTSCNLFLISVKVTLLLTVLNKTNQLKGSNSFPMPSEITVCLCAEWWHGKCIPVQEKASSSEQMQSGTVCLF